MNEIEILELGLTLEHMGFSDYEIDSYLEHFGVKGMHWGQRKAYNKANVARLQSKGLTKRQAKNTNRFQNRVDAERMIAYGRSGELSVLQRLNNRAQANSMISLTTALRHPLSTKNASQLELKKQTEVQRKVAAGEKRATAFMYKLGGVSLKDVNFSSKDSSKKVSTGPKKTSTGPKKVTDKQAIDQVGKFLATQKKGSTGPKKVTNKQAIDQVGKFLAKQK